MSRIEKTQSVSEEIEHMRRDLVSETKKGRNSFGRSLLLFAVFVLLPLFALSFYVAWVLAETGLLSVPVLSSVAYHAPAPMRIVGPGVPLESYLANHAMDLALGSVSLPEETVTTFLRDALLKSGQTVFDDRSAQAVLDGNGGIEVWLPLRDNAQESGVLARLNARAEDGKLVVAVDDASLGSWKAYGWVRKDLVQPAVEKLVDAYGKTLFSQFRLSSIRVEDGELALTISPP